MNETINERQQQIIDFIQAEISAKGYPPSIREIGKAVGLQSTAAVANQLRSLEGKRIIRRDPSKPRAIEIIGRNGGDGLNDVNPLPFPCFDSAASFAGRLKAEEKPGGGGEKMCLRGKALVRVNGDGLPGLSAARFGARDGDYLLVAEPCDLNPADAVLFRSNGGAPRFGVVEEARKKQVVIKCRKSITVPRGDVLGKVSAVIRRFNP